MVVKTCIVSFVDADGLAHAVEVQAETLYEAAALAVKTFREHEWPPAPHHELKVEVRSSVTHTVTLKRVEAWVNGTCKSPKERVLKDRLKELLA